MRKCFSLGKALLVSWRQPALETCGWVLQKHRLGQSGECSLIRCCRGGGGGKAQPIYQGLRLYVPVWSAGTAFVLLSIPRVGSKAFSAGSAGDGSALGERERENLWNWGSEAPKAFLHAQVGCGHGRQPQQVPAGKSVPAASANPRYPTPCGCHGIFEMSWGYVWPGRL